jgi:hypothetical protein
MIHRFRQGTIKSIGLKAPEFAIESIGTRVGFGSQKIGKND